MMRTEPRLDIPAEDWALLDTLLQLVAIDTNYGPAWQNTAKRIRGGLVRTAPPTMEFELKGDGAEIGAALVAAVKAATPRKRKAKDYWLTAKTESERLSYHAVACAMEMLGRELAPQERDGAGALPDPSEPVGATQPPVPSRTRQVPNGSGYDDVPAPVRKLTCNCAQINVDSSADVPGTQWIPGLKDPLCDFHGYRDREAAKAGLCGWRHPCYPDIACTVRDDQWHGAHSSHDARGDIHWNSEIAAQAPTAARAAKDWPEWKGLP